MKATKKNNRKKICIIGLGLIGGSMALKLHEHKLSTQIIGVDTNKMHCRQALDLELVDEILPLTEAIKQSEVIIVATPVDVSISILKKVLNLVTNQIVIDVGSAKFEIARALNYHKNRKQYVSCHPMWGTEYSGPQAAQKNAFEGKAVIICDKYLSDAKVFNWTKMMFEKIGMHIVELNSAIHDKHTAYISHISHITSFALANTVLKKDKAESIIFELASSGFDSTVRLAKSSASMWVPIFLQNRKNILEVLNENITQLNQFKKCIENSNADELQKLILSANKIKNILK